MARFSGPFVLASLWVAVVATPAAAQFSPERIFGYYDQDRDGELDREEMERVRGPLRETLLQSGQRSIDREDFTEIFEKQQRGRGDGDDNRRSSSSAGRSAPKPRERVTLELADKYQDGDMDADGQIGLYEWIQWKSRVAIGEFLALDRNQDGFLTPYELKLAEKSNGGDRDDASEGDRSRRQSTPASSASSPAGGTSPRLDAATMAIAREAFKNLDKDGDGKLSDEEWQRSQAARSRFEQADVQLKTPADLDTFLAQYPAESRSESPEPAAGASPPAGSGFRAGSNFRGGGFRGAESDGEGGGFRRRSGR